ncbi:MAG: hypothetical protein IKQ41_10330 [Clostridia bacterium]|nr:hypothetical protein [Clostridia bacterium]
MKNWKRLLACMVCVMLLSAACPASLAEKAQGEKKSNNLQETVAAAIAGMSPDDLDKDDASSDEDAFSVSGAMIIVGDDTTDPAHENVEYSVETMDVDSQNLTVIIKGLTEKDSDAVMKLIKDNLDSVVDGEPVQVYMPDLLDAEKYSVQLWNYDNQLCWAATAANMLWVSGYAQDVENPLTGELFKNEDEVLDYFRSLYEDAPGSPDQGISVFLNGSDPKEGIPGYAKLKKQPQGLAPEVKAEWEMSSITDNPSNISILDKIYERSIGVLLKSLNLITHEVGDMSHWVTVVGVIVNDKTTSLNERYVGIVLANSDNDPVNGSEDVSDADRAVQAAHAPNSYTTYKLSLVNYGDDFGELWTVEGFLEDPVFATIITWVCSLTDKAKLEPEPQPEPEPEPEPEPQPVPVPQPDPEPAPAPAPSYQESDSQDKAVVKTKYDFDAIEKLMKEEELTVYSPTDWVYDKANGEGFDLFVRASITRLSNLYMDGELIGLKRYSLTDCGNGVFLLSIKQEVMQKLAEGEHSFQLDHLDLDEITEIITVK